MSQSRAKAVNEFVQHEFAIDQLGGNSASEWRIEPKVSAAFTREAAKYVGTPWQEVLERMSEDAQKF